MVCVVARLPPFSAAKDLGLEKISVTSDSGEEGPPYAPDPQETTLPSLLRAVKAFSSEKISVTLGPVFKPVAEELSPPTELDPQVTTLPLLLRAAKEVLLEKICVTPELKLVATKELSAP